MRPSSLLVVVLLAASVAGCIGSDGPWPGERANEDVAGLDAVRPGPDAFHVSLEGNAFVGAPDEIRIGDTITWMHHDGALSPHTVTAGSDAPESFDSSPTCNGMLSPPVSGACMTSGDTFSHTFTTPGTYDIYCKVHGSMSMTLTVLPSNAGASEGGR